MSSLKARSLPRVREALQKAERARFYKQRTTKYLDELRMTRALARIESERIAELSHITHETMTLRMRALHLRDEEKKMLEADVKMMEDVTKKIEFNKKRNFEQEAKYKTGRSRKAFEEKRRRWQQEEQLEPEWRQPMPIRQPQIQLDECLIYPSKRAKQLIQQEFRQKRQSSLPPAEIIRSLMQRLREEAGDSEEKRKEAEAEFLAELERQLQSRDDDNDDDNEDDNEDEEEESPFVTQQISGWQRHQERHQEQQQRILQRILSQIQETRDSIQHWRLTQSQETADRLSQCLIKRKLRRPVDKRTAAGKEDDEDDDEEDDDDDDDDEDDDEEDEDDFDEEEGDQRSFRLPSKTEDAASKTKDAASKTKDAASKTKDAASKTKDAASKTKDAASKRRRRKKSKTRKKSTRIQEEKQERKSVRFKQKGLDPVTEDEEETDLLEVGESPDLDPSVKQLSKTLSRDFKPNDFNKRRQSLMRELDEEFVSPEEKKRRIREFQLAWQEVLRCKYIRGYDPPDMRLPNGQTSTEFVFGDVEQTRQLDRIVKEAEAE